MLHDFLLPEQTFFVFQTLITATGRKLTAPTYPAFLLNVPETQVSKTSNGVRVASEVTSVMQPAPSMTVLLTSAEMYTYAAFFCVFSLHMVKLLLLEYGSMPVADMKQSRTMVPPTSLSIWLSKELKRERNVN